MTSRTLQPSISKNHHSANKLARTRGSPAYRRIKCGCEGGCYNSLIRRPLLVVIARAAPSMLKARPPGGRVCSRGAARASIRRGEPLHPHAATSCDGHTLGPDCRLMDHPAPPRRSSSRSRTRMFIGPLALTGYRRQGAARPLQKGVKRVPPSGGPEIGARPVRTRSPSGASRVSSTV